MTAKTDVLVRRPGRPRELTARELEQIETLLATGQTIAAISRALRRPWSTVRLAVARMQAEATESPDALAGDRGGLVVTEVTDTIQSDHSTSPAAEERGDPEKEEGIG